MLGSSNAELLIAGDFNLSRTKWYNDNNILNYKIIENTHMADQANVVVQYFNEFNLNQFNNVQNSNNNTLDLIFSTLNGLVVRLANESICACDPYHPALLFRCRR